MEDADDVIGPALPPGYKKEVIGPALPPGFLSAGEPSYPGVTNTDKPHRKTIVGPHRPPSKHTADSDSSGTDDSDSDSTGSSDGHRSDSERPGPQPALIGPVIPGHTATQNPAESTRSGDRTSIGPVLTPGLSERYSDEEEDAGIGPRPVTLGEETAAQEEYERRARRMQYLKAQKEQEDGEPHRESWMTELPSVGLAKDIGLQARKLGSGSKAKYEDRSDWTDTPADRLRKQQEAAEGRGVKRPHDSPTRSTRDIQMSEQVSKHNKKARAKSLLDMHMKNLKKDKKKEEKKKKKEKKKKDKKNKKEKKSNTSSPPHPERRAFSREEDLNVNRFDAAQRKSLIQRSQQLNTKFSSGSHQFL